MRLKTEKAEVQLSYLQQNQTVDSFFPFSYQYNESSHIMSRPESRRNIFSMRDNGAHVKKLFYSGNAAAYSKGKKSK